MTDQLQIRQRLASDSHRPRYHFLPPSNWMNDPNGLIHWQGQYHLFYQHNPFGPLWGNMHWGHAVSSDLIHWTDLPIAVAPTPGGPDETGIFSGCAVDNGLPTIIYTGVRGQHHNIQTQCIATSSDNLLTWEKYAGNPVISDVPSVAGQTSDFRDPFVWQEGDTWYMVLASRIQDAGGVIFLYRSTNLTEWEYLNPLLVSPDRRTGDVWECPNFFKLGDQWVLILSGHTGTSISEVFYFVGSYENHRFTPTHEGILDYGNLYAPLTFEDSQKRRLLMGWIREARSDNDQRNAGWSGVQSIPRVLTLDSQNRLQMEPVPELETIRGTHHTSHNVTGQALDIVAEFEPAAATGTYGLSVVCSPDGNEHLDILYDAASQRLTVQRVQPDVQNVINTSARAVLHPLADGEPLQLRVLLDGSVVEIIANQRTSLTSRIYTTQAASQQVRVHGQARSLDIWEMPSIWEH